MARSREELVEALRDEVRSDRRRGLAVEALLTEAADLLDSLEERGTEYRLDLRGNKQRGPDTGVLCGTLGEARARAEACHPAYRSVRVQSRTTFTTPWTDVEEGTDGC